jgi:predicted RNase H-like nuclease
MAIPTAVTPPDRPERLLVRGVDGCSAGWIAVTIAAEGPLAPCVTITRDFAELTAGADKIAVDMPIGLPERAGRGGRGPEAAVRPLVGVRRSSVFSVPSRAAVHQSDYREACRVALATSDPPRKISKQAFFLFPKMRFCGRARHCRTGSLKPTPRSPSGA